LGLEGEVDGDRRGGGGGGGGGGKKIRDLSFVGT